MNNTVHFQEVKTDRLYIKVAEQLRTLIDNDVFKPGDRFPSERALAEKLKVGRPTVREAMIALEISGLIEIRSGSGIYVAAKQEKKLSPDPVGQGVGPFEILEMRYILEPEVCALAAARINPAQVEMLQNIIAQMKNPKLTPEAFELLDHQLHTGIAQCCQNEAMQTSIQWLWDLRKESVFSGFTIEEIKKQGPCITEHERIVQAIAQKNPEKARTAMKYHIDNATTTTNIEFD